MEITPKEFGQRFEILAAYFSDSSDLQTLLQSMTHERVARGTALIRYLGPCATLYLVWDGTLSVSVGADDGKKVTLGDLGPGEWVGEVTMIDPGPSTATVTAVTDCTLLALPHETLNRLRQQHPSAASALLHAFSLNLVERLRAYGEQVLAKVGEAEYQLQPPAPAGGKSGAVALLARLMGIHGGQA